jgi:salicylate hydroxylase
MDGMLVGKVLTTDSSGWNGMYGMHPADLLTIFANVIPPSAICTGHRCIGFEQDARAAHVKFDNGNQFEADIVTACDGIHSTLQKLAVETSSPEYSGSRAYRGLIEAKELRNWRKEAHQIWMGDGKHFMVFPVRRGELLNYVGFVPTSTETAESWSAIGDRDELAASFEGWDRPVVELLDKVETCFWGVSMTAGRWQAGPRGGSFCWAMPPMPCCRISGRAPIRASKTASRWRSS